MTAGPATHPPTNLWWHHPFRMFQTNLREIDAGLDVERTLDEITDYGANAWLLSVGGILANHPSDLDCQTRNPNLSLRPSGDLVGDATAAAARRGVRVLARMDFSKVDHRRAEAHPEWCFVDASGERQVVNGLTSVCPSGDYYQRRLFDVIDEVLDRYPVAGFFFNWMSFNEVDYAKQYRGVCQCLACRRGFAARSPGVPLPTGPADAGYGAWQAFAAATLDDLTARVRAHIAARTPEAPLILGDRADIVFHEANNAVGRTLWHHRTSEAVSASKAARPGVPVLVNSVAFIDMPYRLASEEPHHFAQFLVQAIARGAIPSTYIMGTPAVIRYESLGVGREITRFHGEHEEVYDGLVPDAPVLLLRPGGGGDHARSEFEGVFLGLQERHVPFDVLPVGRLAARAGGPDGLSPYRAIVVPACGALGDGAVAALDAFVAGGGAVVMTGDSGFDGDRAQLAASPVAARLATYDGVEPTRSLHLRTGPAPGGDGVIGGAAGVPAWPAGTPWAGDPADLAGHEGYPVPVVGTFHVVAPAARAETSLPVLSRAPYGPPERCHGHLPLDDQPGRLVGRAAEGGGRVVVLPWSVGRGYRETGLSAHRDLLVAALLDVAPGVAIGGALPEAIEVVAGRSAAGRVLHLLNRSGDAVQRFRAPVPVTGATLAVSAGVSRVRALRAARELPVGGDGGDRYVEVPRVDLFEVLVMD